VSTALSKAHKHDLDLSVFEDVIARGTVEQRAALACQLAALLGDPETPKAELDAVVPCVVSLAVDPVVAVRRGLARALIRIPKLHSDIVFAIAADNDEIALDFLRKTRALDVWRMLAILRVGDFARQEVIAMRGDVAREVVTEIVEAGSAELVACLLDNACAPVSSAHCRRLYARFVDEPQVLDRLLERKDLPLEIRLMHAKRTANRVYQLMAQRGWMAANDAEEVVLSAEENTFLKLLEQAEVHELDRVIPFMCEKQFLTPSIILRAACAGRLEVVERALAYLASVPHKRIHGLIYGSSTLSLKAVHKKTGLPASCYPILRAVFDVARDARNSGEPLEGEAFGRALIEALMVRYEGLLGREKAATLEMIARFGDERSKKIAKRLCDDMRRAA
jgi:uncharacterized protein (DUF2336 family)